MCLGRGVCAHDPKISIQLNSDLDWSPGSRHANRALQDIATAWLKRWRGILEAWKRALSSEKTSAKVILHDWAKGRISSNGPA